MLFKAVRRWCGTCTVAIVVCIGGDCAIAQAYQQTNLVSEIQGLSSAPVPILGLMIVGDGVIPCRTLNTSMLFVTRSVTAANWTSRIHTHLADTRCFAC